MKFQETSISAWLRHPGAQEHLDIVNNAQIILVDKDVDFEYFEKPSLAPYNNPEISSVVDDYYDVLPFPIIIVERMNHDIMQLEDDSGSWHVPFVIYEQMGTRIEVAHLLTPYGEMRGKLWKLERSEVLFEADLGIIKAINNRTMGLATCEYNKQNKHTGNALIKRIVYCANIEKLQTTKVTVDKKIFNYSHEFDVRGHWRKVARLGKNHLGDYCIKGATWVNNFRKGSGEYVKKSRLFI